jgi:hypothetical protein
MGMTVVTFRQVIPLQTPQAKKYCPLCITGIYKNNTLGYLANQLRKTAIFNALNHET